MRPHQLRLVAFGPFAGEVDVDFDAMAAGGLFLLQGHTGAGKTSILDGLAFALYGQVPGQRSSARRLRSDHAEPGLRTSVELEVTIGRRRLRISRWPEQERPKHRGEGTTRDPAKVLLQEAVDGGWRTVSTRVGEVDDELHGLLGMSAEQFHQVVLLPQGEFARFLRSDASERTKLLQRLFSTDRFRRVEDWLAERRRFCAAELDAAVGLLLRTAARVAQAAGVEEPPSDDDGLPSTTWAAELVETAEEAAMADEAVAEADRQRLVEAERRLSEARDLQRRQRRRNELLEQQAAVERSRSLVAELLGRLDAARRATTVRSDLEQADRRRSVDERQRAALARAVERVSDLGLADAEPTVLRSEGQRRRRLLGQLDAAQRLEDDLLTERARQREAQVASTAAGAEIERLHGELTTAPVRLEEARRRLELATAARLQVPALEAEQQRWQRAERDAAKRSELTRRRAGQAEELLAARERAAALKDAAAQLRVERYDFMIAELAAGLVDGDPCAVCGATEHPDPSDVRGSRVTKEQEDAARAASDDAQQRVSDLAASLAGLDAEIAGSTQALTDAGAAEMSVAELKAASSSASDAVSVAGRRAGACDALRNEVDDAEVTSRRLAEALVDAEHRRDRETQRAAEAGERAEEQQRRLRVLLGEARTVRAARVQQQDALDRIDALLEVSAAAESSAQELAAAGSALASAVTVAGFTDAAEARAALLPLDVVAGIERQIDEAHAGEAAVRAALADPELQVDLDPAAPVAGRTEGVAVAQQASRASMATAARSRTRAGELAALAPAFARQAASLEPLRHRASEVRQLADLAAGSGANRLRMTLSSYVLAARLEEVAAVASERLRRMTQGRYTLVHTDTGRGNARSGLGLLARDSWTGQDRDTATLSGGETFLASLALALALGDVVTAEAGGTDIDALFIDEGFGSLDEETLEEVMDTLDALREGGRMVGLVSHVGELRMRIPAQIHVRKGRHGSTVSVHPG